MNSVSFRVWVREFFEDVAESLRGGARAVTKEPAQNAPVPRPSSKDIMVDVIVNRPPGGFGF